MAETAIHSYETIFIIDSTLEPEALEAKKAKFVDIITKNGEIGEVEDWGKRKLAYAINYENDGYYVVYTFTSKTDFPAEFERIINITDGVLRSLVVLSK